MSLDKALTLYLRRLETRAAALAADQLNAEESYEFSIPAGLQFNPSFFADFFTSPAD